MNVHLFQVDASIGLARFRDDGWSAAELLRRADVAMYAAKRDPALTVHRFTDQDNVIVLP